ncbi:AraC family transcriptional regulator [Aliamphritea ceti]|uniref:AraC family transcriptional regulator n=1 Tax=Aliamphritea ceti TaxID=1524258 RepID=UPI0021C385A9|nr:AraC family transcriptional regulator [Aliamphritea ceti]
MTATTPDIRNNCFFARSPSLPQVEMRLADSSSACYGTHSHDEISFGVIDAGSARYQNRQHSHSIGTTTTVMMNPGDAHSCNPDNGEWSYRMLFIDARWIGQLQAEIFQCQGQDYLSFPGPLATEMQSFHQFDALFNALTQPDTGIAEGLMMDYLALRFANVAPLQQETLKTDTDSVRLVREMILDQLDTNITLDSFSSQTGLSRYHLIRSFKKLYGQSPHAWQLDQRIKTAKRLLREGESISDTANQLGFADQAHFQRNFKKRLAITPKLYQSFFI